MSSPKFGQENGLGFGMENFHSGIFILKFTLLANIFDVVQYIVLHPLFNRKAFLMKLFKNFEEQVNFFNVKSYSLAKKKNGHPA